MTPISQAPVWMHLTRQQFARIITGEVHLTVTLDGKIVVRSSTDVRMGLTPRQAIEALPC